MNHRIKSFIFQALEKLPRPLGDQVYHRLQRITAKSVHNEYEFQQATIRQFVDELDKLHLNFDKNRVVEIGSGWLPVLPYDLLFRYRAKEVLTFDINEHYQAATIREFNNFYEKRFQVGLSNPHLPPFVQYFPKKNILNVSIEPETIDAMTSRNVLEHIHPGDLELIHKQAYQYLRKDSFVIHQISPSDHRAYTDHSLSLWDFLQYSQSDWDKIQTRFDYHNRLRQPEYVNLFQQCGFKISMIKSKGAREGQKLPVKIHSDFHKFSEEELTAGSIIVILVPDK